MTAKDLFDSLVKSSALLTKTNAEISALIKSQAKSCLAKWGSKCKRGTWHGVDDCYELAKKECKQAPCELEVGI